MDIVNMNNIEQVLIRANKGRLLVVANIGHSEKRQLVGLDKDGEVVRQDSNAETPKWSSGTSPQARRFFTQWVQEVLMEYRRGQEVKS